MHTTSHRFPRSKRPNANSKSQHSVQTRSPLTTNLQKANPFSTEDISENVQSDPSKTELRSALLRVLSSSEFQSAPQLRAFLQFVVETVLDNRKNEIKGYTIALEALGRDHAFDPVSDPIVRVEAARLRRRLARYYAGTGRADPLIISIPKGGYAPKFDTKTQTHLLKTDQSPDHAQTFFGRSTERPRSSKPAASASTGKVVQLGIKQTGNGYLFGAVSIGDLNLVDARFSTTELLVICAICLIAGYFLGSL